MTRYYGLLSTKFNGHGSWRTLSFLDRSLREKIKNTVSYSSLHFDRNFKVPLSSSFTWIFKFYVSGLFHLGRPLIGESSPSVLNILRRRIDKSQRHIITPTGIPYLRPSSPEPAVSRCDPKWEEGVALAQSTSWYWLSKTGMTAIHFTTAAEVLLRVYVRATLRLGCHRVQPRQPCIGFKGQRIKLVYFTVLCQSPGVWLCDFFHYHRLTIDYYKISEHYRKVHIFRKRWTKALPSMYVVA